MSPTFHERSRKTSVRSLCCSLCFWTTWIQCAIALPQGESTSDRPLAIASSAAALIPSAPQFTGLISTASPQQGLIRSQPPAGIIPSQPPANAIPSQPPFGLIPSGPPSGIIPSQPSGIIPSEPPQGLIPSQPPGIIPSQPPEIISSQPPGIIPSNAPATSTPGPGIIPSGPPPSGLVPSGPRPSGLIPTGPPSSQLIPTGPKPTDTPTVTTIPRSYGNYTGTPTNVSIITSTFMSTDEPLIPIPGQSTKTGNPNGHHEVSEPNFTNTSPCKTCSPILEIPASGFLDDLPSTPIWNPKTSETIQLPNKATITPGTSPVVIIKDPTGDPDNFLVGDSTTIKVGQTITIDHNPIVIRTSSGTAEVIVGGSSTVQFAPNAPPRTPVHIAQSQITEAPILAPVIIGHNTLIPNSKSELVISGQTLKPGGPAITVEGTTISLARSATAIVINGVTSTINQFYGAVYTTTTAPYLTVNNQVYTANRAGYYSLAPGVTLIPGGAPVTVSGTVISLEPQGRTAMIQGTRSILAPVTTIITITRHGGHGGGNSGEQATSDGGVWLPLPTGGSSAVGSMRMSGMLVGEGLLEGVFLIGVVTLGWLAVWL